ncbi:hypothetical protein ELG83_05065 [Rhizobium leguminosarum]|nr:hypothetical protein ELG88_05070 [Rhizobium leguminosarum]TBF39454.1 hypothetical protein ELG92_05060 [Rhizobium leguminosarum]TBF51158.1 hypothetical protein ELG91_05140 [Rhizobium leguminosarum]TBF55827.1 hypothetical protein ELG87_05070 [Rhizobium leguminosarum]TBF60527.1 hypothetical protein ELG90_05135 [Rhizobium leguminosarum]
MAAPHTLTYRVACPHPNPLPVNRERGRALREAGGNGDVAACPFAPFTGRRCRQADEGRAAAGAGGCQMPVIPRLHMLRQSWRAV